MKRLVIYFHFDVQGLLDEPCRFALQAMKPFGDLVLVTNGTLRSEDHQWVEKLGAELIERENVGFDVGAYREALLTYGRDKVSSYEELVLMNYTLAGPVCKLEPMFQAMEQRTELDFWGLTRHYAMKSARFGGRVPEHLQSHFLAIRQKILRNNEFWTYWQTMPLPRSYEESVIHHETRFTDYFQKLGFTWDSYVDTVTLKPIFVNPIMACPRELLEQYGCPFFKRRSFFTPYEDELRRTDGNAAVELYSYLCTKTSYPVAELVSALLRSQPLAALGQNLHWHYIVEDSDQKPVDLEKEGLVLFQFQPMEADAVTSWYWQQQKVWAQTALVQAVRLFREHPHMGALCPALPAWPQAEQQVTQQWAKTRPWLTEQVGVPTNDCPPPTPGAGWLLMRKAAFSNDLPEIQDLRQAWLMILQAQQNGFYTASFESCRQAAGRAIQLQSYTRASLQLAAVAKQLGRLIKHRLKR